MPFKGKKEVLLLVDIHLRKEYFSAFVPNNILLAYAALFCTKYSCQADSNSLLSQLEFEASTETINIFFYVNYS